jgi:class 3 adenylate cyclase/tetratricopeptide (TPR) repeat protein
VPVCAQCGRETPPSFRFCGSCGAPLSSDTTRRWEERKLVTVLFCDTVGSAMRAERLDPEDVRAVLSAYHDRCRQAIQGFGGTLEKFIGDAVMAVFGAPVAREDDATRAVYAALAIRESIAGLNERDRLDLHLRIGIDSGIALVTLGARPEAGEAMVAGDLVNTAARLETAAPIDGILVGAATFRAASRRIVFREQPPVSAKGKAEPVPVWEAVERRASYGAEVQREEPTPLVNRQPEVEALQGAARRARTERTSQLLTLVGVPGIGKSRLVSELFRILDTDPSGTLVAWRQGHSLPYGEGVSLWALAEIVKAHAGVLDDDSSALTEAKLSAVVADAVHDPGDASWVVEHLRPLLGLAGPVELDGDHRDDAFAAWRRFLEAVAEDLPLVLVFEDLHWADDVLLDFIDHLAEWAVSVPLLIVGTARPELLERRSSWSGGKRNASTISLHRLSDDQTAEIASMLLEHGALAPELRRTLVARADGNPLYARELVRMLRERGLLVRQGEGWALARATDLPLPESVQGIIAARLDALPAAEKALVQVASVVGKRVWTGAVAAVAGLERYEAERLMHALERKEYLRRERRSSVGDEREWSFTHALVRDVAYGQVPRARRALLHESVATWITSLTEERAEDQAEMLAHHYRAALDFARAAHTDHAELAERARAAFRDAGDRAASLSAFSTAAAWYAESLALSPHDPGRPRLALRLGHARLLAGEPAGGTLAEAQATLEAAGDVEGTAEAEALLGQVRWFEGHHDDAFALLERARDRLADAAPSRTKATVLGQLGSYLMADGRSSEAIAVSLQALGIAEPLGMDELRAGALTTIGVSRVYAGDLRGIRDLSASLAVSREAGLRETARVLFNLASIHANLGQLELAFRLQDEARRSAERFAHAPALRWLEAERLYQMYWEGRWDAAREAIAALRAEPDATSEYTRFDADLITAWMAVARGELESANVAVDRLLEFGRRAKSPQALRPALAVAARAALAAGNTAEARARLHELLEAWRADEATPASYWTADVAATAGPLGEADAVLAVARAAKAPTRWLDAAVALLEGDAARAADVYAEIGTRPDESYARSRA